MARRTLKTCPCLGCDAHPGTCPALTAAGRCEPCTRTADLARGTASQRGYTSTGHRDFRRAVLARDRTCTVRHPGCTGRSTVADHHPLSRRELVDQGLDPNDPKRGRGTCHTCHSKATATTPGQRGGWNR